MADRPMPLMITRRTLLGAALAGPFLPNGAAANPSIPLDDCAFFRWSRADTIFVAKSSGAPAHYDRTGRSLGRWQALNTAVERFGPGPRIGYLWRGINDASLGVDTISVLDSDDGRYYRRLNFDGTPAFRRTLPGSSASRFVRTWEMDLDATTSFEPFRLILLGPETKPDDAGYQLDGIARDGYVGSFNLWKDPAGALRFGYVRDLIDRFEIDVYELHPARSAKLVRKYVVERPEGTRITSPGADFDPLRNTFTFLSAPPGDGPLKASAWHVQLETLKATRIGIIEGLAPDWSRMQPWAVQTSYSGNQLLVGLGLQAHLLDLPAPPIR